MLQKIVDTVLHGLSQVHPTSYLIDIPPGCEEQPDCIARLERLIGSIPELYRITAVVTADAVRDADGFVDLLVREWSARNHLLQGQTGAEEWVQDLEAPQRLGAFFSRNVSLTRGYRIVLIRRFDALFRRLSRELLAAMRSLEQQGLLFAVNCSPLSYEELYKRRARTELGFTSDYGQFHSRLSAGPLERGEAKTLWEKEYGLTLTGIGQAYFETAYDLSGGVPSAFAVAASQVTGETQPSMSVSAYRSALIERLPSQFDRLLRYDEEDVSRRLIEAVGRLYLGTATVTDKQVLGGHRWRELLMQEVDGALQLRSEALGRKALEMLRSEPDSPAIQPEALYRQREYKACVAAIDQIGAEPFRLLSVASQMMAEVFGDSPQSLYFEARVRWHQVVQLAQEAQRLCRDDMSRLEFQRWERIATAHESGLETGRARKSKVNSGSGDSCERALEDVCIRLGVRILGVLRDRNTVTAAYTAIPLIETVLREYARLVLAVPADGTAFQGISSEKLTEWWREKIDFRLPPEGATLSGASLALLVAVLSADRGKPLFAQPIEFSRLLRLLDERNIFGHDVRTPKGDIGKLLVERAAILLDRLCADGGTQLTIGDIGEWVRPPLHFLSK